MTKAEKERLILLHCPYKLHHFCDGTPNTSVLKEGEEARALPPCRLRGDCPVRNKSRGTTI